MLVVVVVVIIIIIIIILTNCHDIIFPKGMKFSYVRVVTQKKLKC